MDWWLRVAFIFERYCFRLTSICSYIRWNYYDSSSAFLSSRIFYNFTSHLLFKFFKKYAFDNIWNLLFELMRIVCLTFTDGGLKVTVKGSPACFSFLDDSWSLCFAPYFWKSWGISCWWERLNGYKPSVSTISIWDYIQCSQVGR